MKWRLIALCLSIGGILVGIWYQQQHTFYLSIALTIKDLELIRFQKQNEVRQSKR